MKKYALTAFLFLFTAANIFGANYYLDDQNGNDQNQGTSPSAAWKTIKKMSEVELKPGDSVLFKKGGTWRGFISCKTGAKNNPITYSAYGEGAKPVIMGSIPLTKETDWTPVPDKKNLWVTQKPKCATEKKIAPEVPSRSWHTYCDDDGKINFKTVGTKQLPEYRIKCINSGHVSTNIQLTLSPFKVTADKMLVLKFRAKATKPFKISHVALMESYSPWLSLGKTLWAPTEITSEWKEYEVSFQTSRSSNSGRISFFIGSQLPKDCEFDFVPISAYNSDYLTNGIFADVGNIILIEKSGSEKIAGFKRWSIPELKEQADFFHCPKDNVIYFRSDINPAKRYKMIEAVIKRNIFSMSPHIVIDGIHITNGAAHGVGGGGKNALDVTIRNCDIAWIGGGHLYTRNGNNVRYGNGVEFYGGGKDCLVENNVFWEIYDVAMTIQGAGDVLNENIVWRNNVVYNCEQAYEIWFSSKNSVIKDVLFENNTCVDAGFGWSHRQRPDKRATHLLGYGLESKTIQHVMRNNVFTNTVQWLIWYHNGRIGEFDIDNNIWWDDSLDGSDSKKAESLFSWNNDQGKAKAFSVSFEKYKKLTGNDEHSKIIKPIFADPAKRDYRILNQKEIGNAGAIITAK